MGTLEHARGRILAVIDEVECLKHIDWPYADTRDALDILERMFRTQLAVLEKTPQSSKAVINHQCATTLYKLYLYVPILGFILRSTDVRSAFEVVSPLMRLARKLLGPTTKMILSSEWDYSPFVYVSITDLPDFVLIGLPASESSNPLLIPLAGHELGHSVWKTQRYSTRFEKVIVDAVIHEIETNKWSEYQLLYPHIQQSHLAFLGRSTWLLAYTWALLQAEEIFCDFIGLCIFAESYLDAFEYLVSPRTLGMRSLQYPNNVRRASHIAHAAKELGIAASPQFESAFENEDEPTEPSTKLLVSTADAVSSSLVPALLEHARQYVEAKAVPRRDVNEVYLISEEFKERVAPTQGPHSLVAILNAGWKCYRNPNLWENISQIRPKDRDRVLKDIILKSIEVLEYHERLKSQP